MAEHTPGPWKVTGRKVWHQFVRYHVRDARDRLLAEMSWHESSDERFPKGAAAAEANADLIAAAPDILAKLEEIAGECATCMGCTANECPDCADIREIIKKARGSREDRGG